MHWLIVPLICTARIPSGTFLLSLMGFPPKQNQVLGRNRIRKRRSEREDSQHRMQWWMNTTVGTWGSDLLSAERTFPPRMRHFYCWKVVSAGINSCEFLGCSSTYYFSTASKYPHTEVLGVGNDFCIPWTLY